MPRNEEPIRLFTLKQIAAWQRRIPGQEQMWKHVAPPALQRGAVWKPHQVEHLWDSLLRHFPIGSFLIATFDKNRKEAPLRFLDRQMSGEPKYHLMDGQQRANAIALAFVDPWQDEAQPPAALWIDLQKPDEDDIAREYVFRVVTQSHPWGYRRNNPNDRLSAANYRKAIAEFKKFADSFSDDDWKPGGIRSRCVNEMKAVYPRG